MTREDVFDVVKKNIMETVEDVTEEQIDPTLSMVEIGASSLDIVEVVSCSMRDLKVKVPREELMKLDNMDGLVDLLYQAVQEKEQAATATAESASANANGSVSANASLSASESTGEGASQSAGAQ